MNLLDKLVIPLSPEHITLLHYISMLIFFLFVPFISIVLGGNILSLYYKSKGLKESNNLYLRFSRDIIEIVTINKSIGIMLGIMTLVTSILIYVQLFHDANLISVNYLTWAFVFVTIGLILIYTFRYSSAFSDLFNSIQDYKTDDQSIKEELENYRTSSRKLSFKAGRFGLAFLLIGLWLFVAGVTLAFFTKDWSDKNILTILFSWSVISRFIPFIITAIAFTGATILFSFFYWEGGIKNLPEDYKAFVRKTGINLTAFSSIVLPIFILIDITNLPDNAISSGVFFFLTIGLLLLFLGYHYLYVMYKNSDAKYSLHIFLVILLTIFTVIIADQTAMGNANQTQTFLLAQNFETEMAKLTEGNKPKVISGEDIYKNICSACHSFDHKVVGPPYKQTLPKYHDDVDKLVKFILNPTQNNPGYPPMPNPGLKPDEAKAVATYILKEVRKYE
ncbi:MAG: c-type cytochrome [Bacteroidetes bacterium]|nr:c-type cytochrome [Bacteroidota bacterium]